MRDDDAVEPGKGLHDLLGDGLGRLAVTVVEGRLTAAGLTSGNLGLHAGRCHQSQGSKADIGTHGIHQAGDEERNRKRRFSVHSYSNKNR